MASTIQLASKHGNSATTSEHWCVTTLQSVSTVTPTLFFAIPIAQNKGGVLELSVFGNKSDYAMSVGGKQQYTFARGTGNVTIQGSGILSMINSFSGVKPTIVVTANTSTQTIDVTITGAPTYTVNWYAHYSLEYNT